MRFALPDQAAVRLLVYDLLGRRMTVLTDQVYEAGYHEILWDASELPSGTYLLRFETEGYVDTRQIAFLK